MSNYGYLFVCTECGNVRFSEEHPAEPYQNGIKCTGICEGITEHRRMKPDDKEFLETGEVWGHNINGGSNEG